MKKIMIIGLLPLVVGCSGLSTMANDQATLPILNNRTLSLVIHESPDFLAITADKNMFTKAGSDAAYADGSIVVKKNGINDPAAKISKMMAKVISANYGYLYTESSMIKSKSKNMKDLIRLANGKDYLLEVETVGWLFSYNGVNPPDYYVRYIVKTRLIDVAKAKSIRQSSCDYDSAMSGQPVVSYEDLVENNAAYIKQKFDDASMFCVDKFKAELLMDRL